MTGKSQSSRDASHFEQLYARNPDPWNFTGSDYERRKYDATMAALDGRHFATALEVGCSIGVLTQRLAGSCGALLGLDIVPSALDAARQRCASLPHVSFDNLRVPDQWPGQSFDLVLLSEVLYFLVPTDIGRVATHVCRSLHDGGTALLVNYTGQTDDPCSGDEAAEIFIKASQPRLGLIHHQRDEKFRIDLLRVH